MTLALFEKVTYGDPRLRVRIYKPFVARMHARWDILGLAGLVSTKEITIKRLEYEGPKVEGIHRRVRASFNSIPARLCEFWWSIAGRVWDEAPISL